LTRPKEIE